jgi:hypothetical protein
MSSSAREGAQDRLIRNEPFTDRLLVAAGALGLPGAAAFFQSGAERLERRNVRYRGEEVGARILYQCLDLALVIAFAGSAKTLLK